MSVTVVKEKGLTVVTMETGPNNVLPPLCQIIKGFCYSPMCCSVKKGLKQSSVYVALGTVQIMLGLFNIALGPGRTPRNPMDMTAIGAAYWLGCLYIIPGVTSLLAGRFSSICMIGFSVLLNFIGSVFALTGIVLYSIDLDAVIRCDLFSYIGFYDAYGDNCKYVPYIQRMLGCMDIAMILCAVLQLCICISFAVLGIKAVKKRVKEGEEEEEEDTGDAQTLQPALKEVLLTSPCA